MKSNLSFKPNTVFLPSAWPAAASPFWFMLFFLQCFFLSVMGEAEPTSLVEEELETPSSAESDHRRHVSQDCLIVVKKTKSYIEGSVCVWYWPTVWAWFDAEEEHRWTPLLLLRKSAPPSPSISSTCRRLLALTGTKGSKSSKDLAKESFSPTRCVERLSCWDLKMQK